ncbi:MAG TPA: hypothetical protein VF541_16850 [Longimicrobium sp.]|jgi:lauroyl/myristoyl acyltransferase
MRFGAAVRAARLLEPVIRRTAAYRVHRAISVDTLADIALCRVTDALHAAGTCYDAELVIHGWEHLAAAARTGRGVLLAFPHAMLGSLLVRRLHDEGLAYTAITADPAMLVSGTRERAVALLPGQTLLVRARNRLRDGQVLCAMLDARYGPKRRGIDVETADGVRRVSDALVGLALRCDSAVVFTSVHLEGGAVVARIFDPGRERSTGAVTAAFAAFVQAQVAARDGVPAAALAADAPAPRKAAAGSRRARRAKIGARAA